ncbi:hypothetical protein HID58_058547 [Brassica napus]|uniref:Uncharacterized protein n=1 Tax=Brassica napus TaxID=3708 RepID=A0ABQ7ZQB7_BRANA|nr:hypothetical protein HID58_058547 [Brassica napus]
MRAPRDGQSRSHEAFQFSAREASTAGPTKPENVQDKTMKDPPVQCENKSATDTPWTPRQKLLSGTTPERISVSHRLSGIGLIQTSTVGKDRVTSASSNHERVPATHRLVPPPNPLLVLQDDLGSTQNMSSEERLPATLRLGPLPPSAVAETEAPNNERRKPGHPPGKNKKTENQPRENILRKRRQSSKWRLQTR